LLPFLKGDKGEFIRWGIALRSIDEFINDFRFSIEDKFNLLTFMKDSFAIEYNMNKSLKTQLSNKYRNNYDFINKILTRENDKNSNLQPLYELITFRSKQNEFTINKILELKKKSIRKAFV
jgi:hypothetical protein